MERVLIQSDPMCMCLGVGGSGRKYWEIISILFCGGPEQSTPGRKTLEKKISGKATGNLARAVGLIDLMGEKV